MNPCKLTPIATLLLAGLLSACSATSNGGNTAEPVQRANPASVSCIEHGGKLEIRKDADGSAYGLCHFLDGSVCEEWAFYRNECRMGDKFE